MHVVIVIDHAHVNGGQAKVAIDSALGLRARGHRVTFFAAVGPADPRLAQAGVNVVCLDQDDIETAASKLAFANAANKIYDAGHLKQPHVEHFQCTRIDLELENREVQDVFLNDIDGEPLGGLPLRVEMHHKALTLQA